ncbi:helix-turn-helix domain-containing protein [Streptomyces sp. NPDC102395]|uniref:helix-turn-helix domain-containing protein n=1 Tax=Streptomyces sp. NPDC102395 TaxID=3366168 RepID=UPI00381DE51D
MKTSTDHMDAIHDDVAEFALLLTRLKERTDRSYAALARRLDMNASTLHRYCSGEAVPLDFTGIERFAALCGASSQERVELHRRWILAVAARQRSRPSTARPAPKPHNTAPAPSEDGSSTADETPTDPIPEPEPAPPAISGPDPASPTAPLPPPTSSAARRPPVRRERRRSVRSTALTAVLAVALAGLTASAAERPAGDGRPSASAPTTPAPPAPARAGGGPRSAAAGPPSATGTQSPPAPTTSAPATPDPSTPAATGRSNRRETRAGADEALPQVPLTWTADAQLWQSECDHQYVIAKPPRQVPPPPAPTDAAVWAASQEAVHGRTTDLRISVQGRGSAAVVLEALRVRMAHRTTPADSRGIAYSTYEGCGAILIPRYFHVDLDAQRPLARPMPGNDPDRPSPAIDFPYRVSLRQPEVLLLSARTVSCTCDWYLELDWSSQGRTGTVRIDDHGRPFRTTSVEGLPHYWYRNPHGWIPLSTADDDSETAD